MRLVSGSLTRTHTQVDRGLRILMLYIFMFLLSCVHTQADLPKPPTPDSATSQAGFFTIPPLPQTPATPAMGLPPLPAMNPHTFPYMGELGSGEGAPIGAGWMPAGDLAAGSAGMGMVAGQLPAMQGADAAAMGQGHGEAGVSPDLMMALLAQLNPLMMPGQLPAGADAQAAAAGACDAAQPAAGQWDWELGAHAGFGGLGGMQAPAAAVGAAGAAGTGQNALTQALNLDDPMARQRAAEAAIEVLRWLAGPEAPAAAAAVVQQPAGQARGRGSRARPAARDHSMTQLAPTTGRIRKRDEDGGEDTEGGGGRRSRARCQPEQPQQLPAGFPAAPADVDMTDAEQQQPAGIRGAPRRGGNKRCSTQKVEV